MTTADWVRNGRNLRHRIVKSFVDTLNEGEEYHLLFLKQELISVSADFKNRSNTQMSRIIATDSRMKNVGNKKWRKVEK